MAASAFRSVLRKSEQISDRMSQSSHYLLSEALRSNQSSLIPRMLRGSAVSHHSVCPSTGKAQPRAIMAANNCPTEQDHESPPAAVEDPSPFLFIRPYQNIRSDFD